MFLNVKHVSFTWSNLCLGFVFEARKKECDDTENEGRGKYLKTLEDCAANCKGYSGMFIYAFVEDRRTADGYLCYCETSAEAKTCTKIDHPSYNLYKFT